MPTSTTNSTLSTIRTEGISECIGYDGQVYVGPRIVASPLGSIEPGSPVHGVRLEAHSVQSVIEWVLYPSQMDGRPFEVDRP